MSRSLRGGDEQEDQVAMFVSDIMSRLVRVLCGTLGLACVLIAILYDSELSDVRNSLYNAWYQSSSVVETSDNAGARFFRSVLALAESALDWLYGRHLATLQVAAVFCCTAVASFGVRTAIATTGLMGRIAPQDGIGPDFFPLFPFLDTVGMDPQMIPFFYSTCLFFLLLSLAPGVAGAIERQVSSWKAEIGRKALCCILIAGSYLFFEHMVHASKPWPQLVRRLEVAAFLALGFALAYCGLLLFLWLSRKILQFSRTKNTIRLLGPLLYVPLILLLLAPSWSYWVAFWFQEHARQSIWAYPFTHYHAQIYYEWAMVLSSQFNLITIGLSFLIVVMFVFLFAMKLISLVVPRPFYLAYNATAEKNRSKIAVCGLALLTIAFPYYKELFSGLRELIK